MRVTVIGTRFSVRHTHSGIDADKTVVAVASGRVRVEPRDASARSDARPLARTGEAVELIAGQAIVADDRGRIGPVASLSPATVGAWKAGRISVTDTPLVQVLAEFERYGQTGLVVRDPAVAALRLGGSVDVRDLRAFAQALPSLLPVRLVRRDGVTQITSSR